MTACQASEVTAVADHFGLDIAPEAAAPIADYYTAQPDEGRAVIEHLAGTACTTVTCVIREVWPDDSEAWALNVAWCESSMNPEARNGSHYGLYQLAKRFHESKAADLGYTWSEVATEARPNAEVALQLYRQQGARPWAASKGCWG